VIGNESHIVQLIWGYGSRAESFSDVEIDTVCTTLGSEELEVCHPKELTMTLTSCHIYLLLPPARSSSEASKRKRAR
jgi:hypothetical protein